MRIIITGATSFVGRAAAACLESHGHEVIRLRHSFDTEPDKLPNSADVWLHFAWAGAGSSDRADPVIQQYNVDMSMAAVRKACELGCERFVFAGSQAEYGFMQDGSLKQEYGEVYPESEYGKAKDRVRRLAERFLAENEDCAGVPEVPDGDGNEVQNEHGRAADNSVEHSSVNLPDYMDSKRMRYVHMRIFSVYGEGDHPHSLINSLIDGFDRGEAIELGNCTQLWNYLYISDAAEAIRLLCEKADAGIYNVASEDTRPLRDYVEELHDIMGGCGSALFGRRPDNAEGAADLSPDTTRLRELGFKCKLSFAEGISSMLKDKG